MLLVLLLVLLTSDSVSGQYVCPNASVVRVCDRCPDECSGPILGVNCDRGSIDPYYFKCVGSSWGNTLNSFMDINCASIGYKEKYPLIASSVQPYSSRLRCNGTIIMGLWPYDAPNMTFSVDTMFRDPEASQNVVEISPTSNVTTAILNTIYMGCVTFKLRPVHSLTKADAIGEYAPCTLSTHEVVDLSYVGLDLYVCVNTNPTIDPACNEGQWVQLIDGACLDETVVGSAALQDQGNRLLVRVGGPGNLTSCRVQWQLEIDRSEGSCFISDPGRGACCALQCAQGRRLTATCLCACTPGFSGPACDMMEPYVEVAYQLGNTSLEDWLAFTPSEVNDQQVAGRRQNPPMCSFRDLTIFFPL